MVKKIAVFTGSLSHAVKRGILQIDQTNTDVLWLIILHTPKKKLSQLIHSQWKNLCKNGWRWIPYQTSDLIRRTINYWNREYRSSPAPHPFSENLENRENFQILRVNDINSFEAISAIRNFAPDIGLSLAAPILRNGVFDIPSRGTLNLHKGKLPNYRGMPPAFWELWNDEISVGCTIHWVDEKLDSGDIFSEETLGIGKFSTVRGLQLQLDEIGIRLMEKAVSDIFSGRSSRQRQEGSGKMFTKPTLSQMSTLAKKQIRQPLPTTKPLVRALKSVRSTSCSMASKLGVLEALAPRITVLLYHRITDDCRDNLTVGIEQFDRQMALLKKQGDCTYLA